MPGVRVYVGNLPLNIREREIEDLFYKYGKIRDIDLKTPSRPPAFAFVVFEDSRDAEDAIRGRDGYNFDGERLRVEFAKGERGEAPRGGGGRDDPRGRAKSGGGGGRRTEWGVTVTGLPKTCSWQDLKDFMRKAGDVVYTDVDRDGSGIVEFSCREDMEQAVKKLDDTEFRNPFDSAYIRVKLTNKSDSRDSRDRGRGRDKDSDRDRDRDSKRKSTRSPSSSESRSRSRDRSRKPSAADRGSDSDDEPRKRRDDSEEPRKRRDDSEEPRKRRDDDDEDEDRKPAAKAAEDSD